MNSDRDKILKIFDDYSDSVLNKNVEKLLDIYSNSLQIFDMWDVFTIENKQEWKNSIESWFASIATNERVIVTFSRISLTIDSLIAYASAFVEYKAVGTDDKTIRKMNNRITLNLRKENDIWRICHQHTSAPIRSEDTKAIFE